MSAIPLPDDGLTRWSISRLSREFKMGRDTITRRIERAGVKSSGIVGHYPVYRLRDVCPALFSEGTIPADEDFNPERLSPKERRDYFASEVDRLKAYQQAGKLCDAFDVEQQMAALVSPMTQLLETLPDVLERDCGLTPEQVEKVQQACDAERARIADVMSA